MVSAQGLNLMNNLVGFIINISDNKHNDRNGQNKIVERSGLQDTIVIKHLVVNEKRRCSDG